jgi:integration host factor subunit beta
MVESWGYACCIWVLGSREKGSRDVTKRDLIEEVAQQYPRFSRRDTEVMVNAVFDSMTDALAKGERIEIRGFGSFIVKQRAAREGRNPRTGALVAVAAKKVPLFKVGKELRLRVDGQLGEISDETEQDNEFEDEE